MCSKHPSIFYSSLVLRRIAGVYLSCFRAKAENTVDRLLVFTESLLTVTIENQLTYETCLWTVGRRLESRKHRSNVELHTERSLPTQLM